MNSSLGTIQNLVDWYLKDVCIYMDELDMYVRIGSIYDKVVFEYPELKDFDVFVSENELRFEIYGLDISSVDYITESGIYVKTKQRIYDVVKSLYNYYSSFNEDGSLPDYEY